MFIERFDDTKKEQRIRESEVLFYCCCFFLVLTESLEANIGIYRPSGTDLFKMLYNVTNLFPGSFSSGSKSLFVQNETFRWLKNRRKTM